MKTTRGIMFKAWPEFWALVNDKVSNDLNKDSEGINKVINGANQTHTSTLIFASNTFRRKALELWFTKEHIHDTYAAQDSWI